MNKIYSYCPYKSFNIEYLNGSVALLGEIKWITNTQLESTKKAKDLFDLPFLAPLFLSFDSLAGF